MFVSLDRYRYPIVHSHSPQSLAFFWRHRRPCDVQDSFQMLHLDLMFLQRTTAQSRSSNRDPDAMMAHQIRNGMRNGR